MPIKPENKARYPANWKDIRARILEREGNRCKFCGARNHAFGYREPDTRVFVDCGDSICDAVDAIFLAGADDDERAIRIVLTIAHLHDMDPSNCADDNLAALCQRCHNIHDQQHRQRNAATTRAAKRDAESGQLPLIGEIP